jgi:acetyl esterase/lipase
VHALFLVNHGFAVASVDYRFSNVAHFPAQILDCKAAVRYLRAKAGQYGLDTKRFVAMGESAGGQLTSLLATTGDDPAYLDAASSSSDAVQAAIDVCGPSDFTTTPDSGAPDTAPYFIGKLLGQPPSQCPDLARQASPMFHVSAKTPPIFIMHAAGDPVCPVSQSHELFDVLQKHGIPSELTIIPVDAHVGPFFWTPEMQGKMLAFLHKSLGLQASGS